ncbi:MAG: FISUMP domain-containing protein [Aureispira sp.]
MLEENKRKRFVFRENYNRLTSKKKQQKYIQDLGQAFNEILKGKFLYQDTRDGQLYDCMFIGETRWMAQNFAFETNGFLGDGSYHWEGSINACPDGWRLPTASDFNQLIIKAEEIVGEDLDPLENFSFEVLEVLEENQQLEFNAGSVDYGFPRSYLPFWTAEKEYFFLYAGQNEIAYGLEKPYDFDEGAFVRYVQDV